MTTYDFFISHTQCDSDAKLIALELYGGFQALEKSCWLDVKMQKRDMEAMKEGVRESRCFLAILTNNGKDSYLSRDMCRQEIMWAIESKKPIVPVANILDKPRLNDFISEAKQYNIDLSKLNFCSISRESPAFITASLNQIIEQSAMPFKAEVLISTESHVRGLSELLASIHLSDYLVNAQKWCECEGAQSVEDIAGFETEFVEHLDLKSIPKRKLLEALQRLTSVSREVPEKADTAKAEAAAKAVAEAEAQATAQAKAAKKAAEQEEVVKPAAAKAEAWAAARPSAVAMANFCRKVGIRDVQSVRQEAVLDWNFKQLNADDCKVIAYLIASGALANLTKLYLSGNQIGDAGIKIFSETVASGALANLTTLYLHDNQIGDEGIKSFSTALASGALANLTILWLSKNKIGDEGIKVFSSALASGALANLTKLWLDSNKIGDEGINTFSTALASGALANLTKLYLSGNQIGDAGIKIFSETVASGALAKLEFYIDGKNNKTCLVAACKPRAIKIKS